MGEHDARLIIRGYVDGALRFEERLTIDEATDVEAIAARHALALAHEPRYMLEWEFPDMPMNERFLRFGSDPSQMVEPLAVDLEGLEKP